MCPTSYPWTVPPRGGRVWDVPRARKSSREQAGMKGGDHWTTGSLINMILMEAEGLLWKEVAAGAAGCPGSQQENWELKHSRSSPQCPSMGDKYDLIPKKPQKCPQVTFSIFRSRLPSSLLCVMCWPSTCCRLGILVVVSSWDLVGICVGKLRWMGGGG